MDTKRSHTQSPELQALPPPPPLKLPGSILPTPVAQISLSHDDIHDWEELSSSSQDTPLTPRPPSSTPPSPSTSSIAYGSPTSDLIDNIMVAAASDARGKLKAFNIHVDTLVDPPLDLQQHINQVVFAARTKDSPSGKKLYDLKRGALGKSERTAIALLVDDLLFKASLKDGEPKIAVHHELNLYDKFLPTPPTQEVAEIHKKLTSAIVDTAITYIAYDDAPHGGVATALSEEEEIKVC